MAVTVAPNSTIQLLNVTGLDNRYLHTYYFASTAAQTDFFNSKVSATFNAQSYARNTANSFKLQVPAPAQLQSFFQHNYMRFQNTSFGSKWFYAFINSVDYVNNITVRVSFEIDELQTWLFDSSIHLGKCYIERRTPKASEDTLYDNWEDEPVQTKEFKFNDIDQYNLYQVGTSLMVMYTPKSYNEGDCVRFQNMFTGMAIKRLAVDTAADIINAGNELNDIVSGTDSYGDAIQETERIASIVQMPSMMVNLDGVNEAREWYVDYTPTSLDGYTPKNKKLLTYPFCYMRLTDKNGGNVDLQYERFTNHSGRLQFRVHFTALGAGEVMVFPWGYKGQVEQMDYKLVITNFPQVSISQDTYRAWVAQGGYATVQNNLETNKIYRDAATANTVIDSVVTMVNAGITFAEASGGSDSSDTSATAGLAKTTIGVIGSIGHTAVNNISSKQVAENNANLEFGKAKAMPDNIIGNTTNNLMVQMEKQIPYLQKVCLTANEAERIDSFFTTFGYTQHKVDVPIYNPTLANNGKHEFVKTQAACVSGNVPATALAAINKVLDGGITFWSSSSTIGDY